MPNSKQYHGVWYWDNQHIALKKDAGDNVYQLLKFNRFTKKTTTLATVENTDIDPTLDHDTKLIGYKTHKDGVPSNVYFDEQSKEAQFRRLIDKTFKGYKTTVYNGSDSGNRRMIKVWSDTEPGKHYLYDANAKIKLCLLAANKQKIKRDRFSTMAPFQFTARDGLKLHGYLSRPNRSKGNDPMVVLAHNI